MDEDEDKKWWADQDVCLRCDEHTKGLCMMYCGTCYREGNRNSGVVGPIFGYGG